MSRSPAWSLRTWPCLNAFFGIQQHLWLFLLAFIDEYCLSQPWLPYSAGSMVSLTQCKSFLSCSAPAPRVSVSFTGRLLFALWYKLDYYCMVYAR
ncbi:hypothetical protein R3P38DRAFT_205759 [Favolaschia claudopus]|uniref:Secreted protein n=1 Tax=Favolaschia claudopus TaxID=2862362 RepID=A0AAV9ZU16_9AGAR